MKKTNLLKVLSLSIICISFTTSLYGCKSKDKEIVVAENVKEDLRSTNAEILQLIEEGNAFLQSGKFPEARSTYEKAISKDKTNENTYLQIKDTYMNAKRFDDAYYIIKLAIDNNVSKDVMSKLLDEIKTNFSTIQLEDTISQGSDYDLPNPTTTSVDTIPNPVNIRWTQKNIDTSRPGTFTFDGYIDEYGRTVQLKLTVKEVVKQTKEVQNTPKDIINSTKTGFIKDIYEEGDNTLIKFDEVQFFKDAEAEKEFNKDNTNPSKQFTDSYYIRNNNDEQKSYILSPNCNYNLCTYLIDSNTDKNPIDLKAVSLKDFENYINTMKQKISSSNDLRRLLFSITIENNIVTNISMQYTP